MKKRLSVMIVRLLTALLTAAVFITAVFALPTVADEDPEVPEETVVEEIVDADEEIAETAVETETETEEEPEFIAFEDFPEAFIEDSWQGAEENGDDTEKQYDSMRLMDTYTYDAAFEAQISDFPDSYKDALRRIHSMYPNFTFVADSIGMTLDQAVRLQIQYGYKTYRGTFTDDYDTIYTFMNPLTYLYPKYDPRYDVYSSSFDIDWHYDADFFMFADHAYSTDQYGAALYFLIEGCDFLEDENMDSIIAASAIHDMNPYVMASTVILEKGWHAQANGNGDVTGRVVNKGRVSEASVYSQAGGSSVLATLRNTDVYIVAGGNVTTSDGKQWLKIVYDYDGNLFDSSVHGIPGFVEASKVSNIAYFNTYYNLFSVNQSDDNPVVGGIAYAMSHGWDSIAKSFEGGADFCKTFYYDNDQTNYYYMHYNVLNSPTSWWHEYSTGVSAGLKCTRILRYAYDYDHDQSLVLHIPVYDPEPSVRLYNGVWTYLDSQGVPDYTYNGVADNENGTWFIRNGVVDFTVEGIADANGTLYLFKGGKVRTDYTGIARASDNTNTWWRVVNGKVDPYADGVYLNENGWWYCKDGKVQFSYTGIKPNSNGWWRIVNGKVDFNCTSVEMNENGWWYIKDGKVQFGYTGIKPNSNGWWRIENGKVNFNFTGLASNENGWWYLSNGKVDFSYKGIVQNSSGYWYVVGGKVQFGYTGIAKGRYGRYYIENGKINWNYTGTYTDGNGNRYTIVDGEVR